MIVTPIIVPANDCGVPATDVECHAVELLLGLAVVGEPTEKFAFTVRKVFESTEQQRARRLLGRALCDEPA